MRSFTRPCLLGAALACAMLPAQAQWYVGAAAGQSRSSLGGGGQADQLLDLGFVTATTSIDDKDTFYRLHGGYRLHRNISLEAGYVDLGKFRLHSTVSPAGTLDTDIKVHGFDVSGVGLLPVGERFTLFARAGAFLARTRASYSSSGSVRLIQGAQTQTKNSTQLVYGAGVMFDVQPRLGVRLEWTRYDKLGNELTGGDFNGRSLSAGIEWRF